MHWCMALGFNCLSTVAAIVGFFVGVSIGTESEQANDWILAVTAGQFLYIALVDLVSVLLLGKARGQPLHGFYIQVATAVHSYANWLLPKSHRYVTQEVMCH